MPIPEDLQEIFDDLDSQLVLVHVRWQMYRQLYAVSSLRVDLLNDSAATFFHFAQFVWLDDTVLAIARITDPARQGKYQNCVLEQLILGLQGEEHEAIRTRLTKRHVSIEATCEQLRRRRKKHIAHRDLRTALASFDDPIPSVSREMVETSLRKIREYMNDFRVHFTDISSGYEHVLTYRGGDALVFALKQAAEFRHLQSTGEIPPGRLFDNPFRDA